MLKPFGNLWPVYASPEEFEVDYRYTSFLTAETLPQLVDFYQKNIVEDVQDFLEIQLIKNVATNARALLTTPADSTPIETINLAKQRNIVHSYFTELRRNTRPLKLTQAVTQFQSVKMPANFLKILAAENLICEHRANRWVVEYKKFLALAYFTTGHCVPSEQVDIVWHLHTQYMPNYRRMCTNVFGGVIWPHQCSMQFGLTEISQAGYLNTLSYYKQMFQCDAPPDIWEDYQTKGQMRTMVFRFVNMYRMATMYVMKKKNPKFLKPKKKKIPVIEEAIREDPPITIDKPDPAEIEALEDPAEQERANAEILAMRAQLDEMREAKAQEAESNGNMLKAEKTRLRAETKRLAQQKRTIQTNHKKKSKQMAKEMARLRAELQAEEERNVLEA